MLTVQGAWALTAPASAARPRTAIVNTPTPCRRVGPATTAQGYRELTRLPRTFGEVRSRTTSLGVLAWASQTIVRPFHLMRGRATDPP